MPHDRSASFGRNHRVNRILQHHYPVTDGDSERSTGTTLSGNHDHDRNWQPGHFADISRDGLGLPALLRVYSRVGSRRIHEHKYRPPEFRGEVHRAQCLAIAFGLRLPEVARQALLRVPPLLVANDQNGAPAERCHACDKRGIVRKIAVAMNFAEILK